VVYTLLIRFLFYFIIYLLLIHSIFDYLVKELMFGGFMWKRNVLVIIYFFVVAENYVDFCPRTIDICGRTHSFLPLPSLRLACSQMNTGLKLGHLQLLSCRQPVLLDLGTGVYPWHPGCYSTPAIAEFHR